MPELLLFAASEPRRLASGWLCGTDDPTARYPEHEVRPRAPPEGPSRLPLRCDDEFAVLWYHPSMQQPVHDEKLLMDDAMSAIRRAIVDEVAGEETLMPSEPRPPAKKRKRKEYPRLDCCRA